VDLGFDFRGDAQRLFNLDDRAKAVGTAAPLGWQIGSVARAIVDHNSLVAELDGKCSHTHRPGEFRRPKHLCHRQTKLGLDLPVEKNLCPG
jgi:hypothetical protein